MTRTATVVLLVLLGCSTASEPRHSVSSPAGPRPSAPLALEGSAYEAAGRLALPEASPTETPGLHNVYELSDDIISGAEPEGPEALATIASWGVKTILSVDGKVPDAETAAALGMRYVHVPIQYSGIDRDELLRIAKTFRELEGPFYVHCYHGKHRGPAAAAVGRVVLDGVPRDRAIAEMRQWCATASKYEGLYATVAQADLPTSEESAAYDFDFSPAHSFGGLRAGMTELARKWDLVKAAKARGWEVDPEHPDVEPLQEVTQLHQLFEAMAALDEVRAYPDDFRAWLDEGRGGSEALVRALTESSMDDAHEVQWRAAADTAHARVSNSCADCHAVYRD
jgi:protein tyrosine phosphatase (PTP) superfamily phosphohydrolase (DUF442 family)